MKNWKTVGRLIALVICYISMVLGSALGFIAVFSEIMDAIRYDME